MNNPMPGFLTRSSMSETGTVGNLTKEAIQAAMTSLGNTPATVEDYKWWVGKSPQVGGFITRSTMEDPPPNPLYMELFE